MLFVWLLWGDLCFTIMEAVVPSILPLKLKDLGASSTLISLTLTTLPSAMNFALNPIISFRSDRTRTRWGRRIPFLLFATPPLAFFLILMGLSGDLGKWLAGVLGSWSPEHATIALLVGFMVGFQFFNLFVASVYYYLFNDVVPPHLLSRFMSLFRIVGTLGGALYNMFIFRFAESHAAEIFIGAAILYLIAFGSMCLKVREGDYPPPPEFVKRGPGILAAAKTYFTECFTHRLYWFFFLANGFWAMGWCIMGFNVFFAKSLGISLGQFGNINGWIGIAGTLLLYPAGILADRFHPLRISLFALPAMILSCFLSLIFLFREFSPSTALAIWVVIQCINLPAITLYGASMLPMYMRILPRERYGQFSSANAMVGSLGSIIGGLLAGLFLDFTRTLVGDERAYQFLPLWLIVFQAASLICLFLLHREWMKNGGVKNYIPPGFG